MTALVLGWGLSARANEPGKAEPASAKPNPNAQAVNRIAAAASLIDYGREHKSPIALITAAQLLHDTPTRPLRDMFKDDAKAQEELDKQTDKDDKDAPEALLSEAKKMVSDDANVAALAAEVEKQLNEKPKSASAGAYSTVFIMEPHEKTLMSFAFKGGEDAEVACQALGDGQVELKASDPKEGVDVSDVGPSVRVKWFQRADGRVNVIRKNLTDHRLRVFVSVP
jgi:hypothetical protein